MFYQLAVISCSELIICMFCLVVYHVPLFATAWSVCLSVCLSIVLKLSRRGTVKKRVHSEKFALTSDR